MFHVNCWKCVLNIYCTVRKVWCRYKAYVRRRDAIKPEELFLKHAEHKKHTKIWLIYHDRAAHKLEITGTHRQRTKMHPKLRDQSTHLLLKVWKYYFWALTIICCHQLFLSSLKLVLFHAQGSAQEEYTGFLLCWLKVEICEMGFNILQKALNGHWSQKQQSNSAKKHWGM